MDKAIEKLLNYLCVEWGFCIDQESINILKTSQQLEADEFACAVLKAEGMDPDMEIEWKRKIRNKFIKHIGSHMNGS